MSEEKKEKNLDIAASKESNETEQKIDAVATNESSTINEQNNDMKKENNSIEKNDNVVTKENNSLEKKQEKKFNFKNVFDTIKRSFTNKQFRSGAYSSVLTVLVIAIVVVVNLVFGKLDLSTDLSSGSYFTLSKTTKKILKQVDSDITIYYMVQDGSEQDYISNALKQYNKVSKHVKVKRIDPVVNPGFAKKQGIDDEISSNDVIVVNNKTKSAKYISNEDMYIESNSMYSSGSSSTSLDVEGQVTAAIQNVISDSSTKMYVLTKHSETELGDTLKSALEKMNYEISDLELATKDSVPSDCDVLYINGLTTDITTEEKDKILDYLKNGGSAIINVGYTTEKMTNFKEILAYYGVNVTSGIICEGTGNYATYPNYIVPSVGSDSSLLSDLSGYIIFPDAAGLSKASSDSVRSTVKITDLLDTSDSSFIKVDPSSGSASKEDGDVDGPFSVGYSITETVDKKETNLLVFASSGAFSESFTQTTQLANATVFKKAASSLSKSDVKEASIDKKNLSYSYVSLTSGTQLLWAAIIIVIIPGGLLICGFLIWFFRRRK
ncbi:uncharacterized protein BN547_00186 [Clostridium sp. CAG:230]|nr:uncharacterized protein BN547_00186 [Clostridium sp. CAG:230]